MMKEFRSADELAEWLTGQGIDVSNWGEGATKSVHNLWTEVDRGETHLLEDPPLRLVEVARVLVRRNNRLLIEVGQDLASGEYRERDRPPSEKMRPGEDYREAALRCLQEELGVEAGNVTLLNDTYQCKKWRGPSDSYPGLCTHYTFHIIAARVEGLPDNDFSTIEYASGPGDPVSMHYWVWREANSSGSA